MNKTELNVALAKLQGMHDVRIDPYDNGENVSVMACLSPGGPYRIYSYEDTERFVALATAYNAFPTLLAPGGMWIAWAGQSSGTGETPAEATARAIVGAFDGHKPPGQNIDDRMVVNISVLMHQKMAAARKKGRGGWNTADPDYLRILLHEHVRKGDPVDVANIAGMLAARGLSTRFSPNAENRSHTPSADCWCNPILDTSLPDQEAEVYIHRDIPQEPNT